MKVSEKHGQLSQEEEETHNVRELQHSKQTCTICLKAVKFLPEPNKTENIYFTAYSETYLVLGGIY